MFVVTYWHGVAFSKALAGGSKTTSNMCKFIALNPLATPVNGVLIQELALCSHFEKRVFKLQRAGGSRPSVAIAEHVDGCAVTLGCRPER